MNILKTEFQIISQMMENSEANRSQAASALVIPSTLQYLGNLQENRS